MRRKYNKVDVNNLNIQTLSAYQITSNFLSKLTHHYSRNLDIIQFNRGTFYKLISHAHERKITASDNQNLPANLRIFYFQTIKTLEVLDYELIRVTTTPIHLANASYCILDDSLNHIAIDYKNNLYLELNEEENNN